MLPSIYLLTALTAVTAAQTTYTGCHNHTSASATILYCFGPDGRESARETFIASGSAGASPAVTSATTTGASGGGQTTAVTGCHSHGTALYCINGAGAEVSVKATVTGEPPSQFTGCHSHGSEQFCVDSQGKDVAIAAAAAQITAAPTASATATGQTTAVTACHSHETAIFCINGAGAEVEVKATPTGALPAAYTGCHSHGSSTFCLDPAGEEVSVVTEGAEATTESETAGCHFHAGVEHCPGQESSCGIRVREYNVGLRIGSLFIILVTSAIGVFAPLLLQKLPLGKVGSGLLLVVKQFGTGIIIATAFIHLYTHADLMFSNHCLGELGYEATTSAVVMVGIFLSFLVEYVGLRFIRSRAPPSAAGSAVSVDDKDPKDPNYTTLATLDHHHHGGPNSKLSVAVMEAGIVFHSILIGLTLVLAGDSFYKTLLVVIVFHQFFEGLALGARIALLPGGIFVGKFLMALTFALITPIGMAIGIGILNSFNGNSPATVIAFGTLDALSAGILVWVGVVDMWARDWVIEGGEMVASGVFKTLGAGLSLIAGFVLMGLLGKWA